MDWSSLISAVLAGGLAGQLTTLLLGDRFSARREFRNWLRTERFKVYSELVTLVASSSPECGYDRWPGHIRALCQKVYLLHPRGTPPPSLTAAMESVFQRAYAKKRNKVEDHEGWVEELRQEANHLREELAKLLHSDE